MSGISTRPRRGWIRPVLLVTALAVLPVTVACTDAEGDPVALPSLSVDLPSGLPTELPTEFPTEIGDTNDSVQVGDPVELSGTVTSDGAVLLEVLPDGETEAVPVFTLESLTVSKGDHVALSGRWVSFDAATLEDELGVDLDDELVARYSGRQAVVATSVTEQPAAG